jgi:hypothetical protein
MLDKTQHTEVVEKDLGIGVQFSVTVGSGRQIAMTAGIPLHWDRIAIDNVLDKLGGAMERQTAKYAIDDLKLAIEQTERALATTRQQMGNYDQQNAAEWERSGRKGAYRQSESQVKQMGNFRNTEQAQLAAIEKLRKDLKDAEAKCR